MKLQIFQVDAFASQPFTGNPAAVVPLDEWLPAPAQGAIVVECRADDADTRALLAAIDHPPSRSEVVALVQCTLRYFPALMTKAFVTPFG